jgi:hypothetical protein
MMHAITRIRCGVWAGWLAVLLGPLDHAGAQQFARWAPADAGLYVEIRNCNDLLTALSEPQRWTALAELAGQPAAPADAARWRERVQATIGMPPATAIERLFSRGVAFVAPGPRQSQDAVVLCRPDAAIPIIELLNQWEVTRFDTAELAGAFQLRGGLGLGLFGDVLVFGSATPRDGLFRGVLAQAAADQPQSLQQTVAFRRLIERVAPHPDGILFARLSAPSSQPALAATTQPGAPVVAGTAMRAETAALDASIRTALPAALRGADHVLVALHRDARTLRFTAVSDAPERAPPAPLRGAGLRQLPAQTIAAWSGVLDIAAIERAILSLPQNNLGNMMLQQQRTSISAALTGRVVLAVGASRHPLHGGGTAAVGVLLETRDAPQAATLIDGAVRFGKLLFDTYAGQQGLMPLPAIEDAARGGQQLALTDHVGPLLPEMLGAVELTWQLSDDWLIMATDSAWLDAIIAARQQESSGFLEAFDTAGALNSVHGETIVAIHFARIADLGAGWLERLSQNAPQVLTEDYWRAHQPLAGAPRLGVTLRPAADARRLLVESVEPGQPAAGVLRAGDVIVGTDTELFVRSARREIQTAILERPHARWVELLVERDGVVLRLRVPLPFVDPVHLLRQFIAVGQIVEDVVYADDWNSGTGPRGVLTVGLRASPTGDAD